MIRNIGEAWWHRLIKAVLFISVLITGLISMALGFDHARPQKYYYSWKHEGIPSELLAASTKCEVRIYEAIASSSVGGCGTYYDASDVLNDMVSSGIVNVAHIPSPRGELSDGYTLDALNKAYNYRSANRRELDLKKSFEAGTWVIASLSIAVLVALSVFSLIVYIAHGKGARIIPPSRMNS